MLGALLLWIWCDLEVPLGVGATVPPHLSEQEFRPRPRLHTIAPRAPLPQRVRWHIGRNYGARQVGRVESVMPDKAP